MKGKSYLEKEFRILWGRFAPYIPYKAEQQLIPGRRFRHDFVFPDAKVAIEIQGATYVKGAHSSGTGIKRDYEKNLLAAKQGYLTIFLTSTMLTPEYIQDIIEVIKLRSGINDAF